MYWGNDKNKQTHFCRINEIQFQSICFCFGKMRATHFGKMCWKAAFLSFLNGWIHKSKLFENERVIWMEQLWHRVFLSSSSSFFSCLPFLYISQNVKSIIPKTCLITSNRKQFNEIGSCVINGLSFNSHFWRIFTSNFRSPVKRFGCDLSRL